MHLQFLASGSRGNSALVRAGETSILVDAGLSSRELAARLEVAGLAARRLDHLLISHGHLDHARSAGLLAQRSGATLHCAQALMANASIRRAPRMSTIRIGGEFELAAEDGRDPVRVRPVLVPHDADPTVAYRLEQGGRVAVIATDIGTPRPVAAGALAGAHVLVLEFNHDPDRLAAGPYPVHLKRRIRGDGGHLSNQQAAEFLARLAGPQLHTLVLAHLSEQNNTPELARACARAALEELSLGRVEVLVASQEEVGPNLEV